MTEIASFGTKMLSSAFFHSHYNVQKYYAELYVLNDHIRQLIYALNSRFNRLDVRTTTNDQNVIDSHLKDPLPLIVVYCWNSLFFFMEIETKRIE